MATFTLESVMTFLTDLKPFIAINRSQINCLAIVCVLYPLFLLSSTCYANTQYPPSKKESYFHLKPLSKNQARHLRLKNSTNTKNKTDKKNKTDDDEEAPPKLGNFALPSSQQPGSLISFGENIFDENTWMAGAIGDYYKGAGLYYKEVVPYAIYSFTDTTTMLLAAPIALKFRDLNSHVTGREDILAQFEHAVYVKSNTAFTDQGTIVANVSFPSGQAAKDPPTGYGAPTYFIGGSFLRSYVDWLFLTSNGVLFPGKHHGTQFGTQFLYQFGLGKNIAFVEDQWIFNWLLELTGQYTRKNKFDNEIDSDSGGNVIYLTPSLWFSTKHVILQFGVGKPVVQKLFGNQQKIHYVIFGNFSWTFY